MSWFNLSPHERQTKKSFDFLSLSEVNLGFDSVMLAASYINVTDCVLS